MRERSLLNKGKKASNPFELSILSMALRDLGFGFTNNIRVQILNGSDVDVTATQIIDGTLTGLVGPGNEGRVEICYSQKGDNLVQNSFLDQFKIVENGNLVQVNGRPALKSVPNCFYQMPEITFTHMFIVCNPINDNRIFSHSVDNTFARIRDESTDRVQIRNNGNDQNPEFNSGIPFGNQCLIIFDTVQNTVTINGVQQNNSINLSPITIDRLFARSTGTNPLEFVQEIHFFNEPGGFDRTPIVENLNNHYNIY
jgi:hypothetical protein